MTEPTPDTALDYTDRFIDNSYLQQPDEERTGSGKPRPTPGPYFLKFGTVEAAFKAATDKFPFDQVEVTPNLTIVADKDGNTTFASTPIQKYYRLSTVPMKGKNYSAASDALKLFGQELPGKVSDIIAAFQQLSGLETPVPVFLSLRGRQGSGPLKGRNYMEVNGSKVYFKEQHFRKGDQSAKLGDYLESGAGWASVGYIVNDEFTLTKPSENVEHVVVFTDLEPTPYGWKQ